MEQKKKLFFDPTEERLYPTLPPPPTNDDILDLIEESPLSNIIVSKENKGKMRILQRFAFNAFTKPDRSCRGMNFAIYAGPGQGKTYIVKKWAETIGLPFLFVQSDNLSSTWMLLDLLKAVMAENKLPLHLVDNHYTLPPCLVFFDEAHALSSDLRTGGLLNAMEANDGWLRTKKPGKNQRQILVDCREVCWIAASTDPGLILKQSQAFYDRFRTHIEWAKAGPKEIARIVRMDSKNKQSLLPKPACEIVAHYEKVPRKAIAFADQMRMEKTMNRTTWRKAAKIVAHDNGIDPYGMPYIVVELLKQLAVRPISDKHIVTVAKCRREQFESQYVPILLANDGNGPIAQPTPKGWAITRAGCEELNRRNIQHQGDDVLAEYM